MVMTLAAVVGKLFGLTVLGFLLFQIRFLRERVLNPLLWILVNVLLPLYLIHRLTTGWEDALQFGWEWTLVFFFGCWGAIAIQSIIGAWIVYRTRWLPTENPREAVALFGVHNAVFIPFPILAVLAPEEINVFLFFYFFAFSLMLWSYLVSLIGGQETIRLKITPPLVAMLVGIIAVLLGWHHAVPDRAMDVIGAVSRTSMDIILIVLGGILATVPKADLAYKPEFGRLVVLRMLVFPALVLLLAWLIPSSVGQEFQWGLRITLIIEAAVPPATNVLLISKAFGTEKQVHYAGGAILTTYLASVVTIPLFLAAAILLFGV